MKKPDLTRKLAKRSGLSKAQAADELDHVVHQILSRLKRGEPAHLPGLGKFIPGRKLDFQFDRENSKRTGGRGER